MYLPCPVADAIFLKSTSKGKARKFLEDNRDFIKFLEKKTGLTIKTVRDLQYIYDPLNCEVQREYTISYLVYLKQFFSAHPSRRS